MSTQAPPPATARLARARPRQNELDQSQTRGPGSLASSLLESPVVRLLPLLALFVVALLEPLLLLLLLPHAARNRADAPAPAAPTRKAFRRLRRRAIQ